jgi:hypothetical protein
MTVTGENAVAETRELRDRMTGLLDQTIKAYPQTEDGAWWMPRSYGGTAPTPEEALVLDAEEKRRRAEKRRAERAAKPKK